MLKHPRPLTSGGATGYHPAGRTRSDAIAAGRRLAAFLSKAWRGSPHLPSLPDDFESLVPMLLNTGSAGLAWYLLRDRVEGLDLASVKEAWQRQCLRVLANEHEIPRIFSLLESAGIQPMVFKGWAVGRLYPQPGMRPYGDLDMCITPERMEAARALLKGQTPNVSLDLHSVLLDCYGRSVAELLSRAVTAPLGDVPIRVPCDEDHLRLVAIHALIHGVSRPIWLCDVALMVEGSRRLDWDRVLSGTRRQAEWVRCVMLLTRHLLDADLAGTPFEADHRPLPRWLPEAVLREWGAGDSRSRMTSMATLLAGRPQVRLLMAELRNRWRNPIEATVEVGAPFDDMPRLPWQVAALLVRGHRWLLEMRPSRKG